MPCIPYDPSNNGFWNLQGPGGRPGFGRGGGGGGFGGGGGGGFGSGPTSSDLS